MEKENLYLIHGEDYLRHIEEKLELLWMATILMHYIKNGAEKDSYLDLVRRSTLDFDERCEEMFSSWGRALNYLKSRDLADLSDLIENDLIEPEYAGYVPAGAYIYYSFTTFGCIFMLVNTSLCKVSSKKKIPINP